MVKVGPARIRGLWGIPLALLASHPGIAAAEHVDQEAIHHAYNEGDFDAVLKLTDPFTNGKGTYTRADSAFVFKHLAVVYTANPKTREKGKFYMYQLLEMLPSAELVDMYVSDEVDRIFDRVRKEFKLRQRNFGVDTSQISLPDKAPASHPGAVAAGPASDPAKPAPEPANASAEKRKLDPIWYWVAGGAAVAGAGLAAVLLMQPDGPSAGKTYVISGN